MKITYRLVLLARDALYNKALDEPDSYKADALHDAVEAIDDALTVCGDLDA